MKILLYVTIMCLFIVACDNSKYEPEARKWSHKQRIEKDAHESIVLVTLSNGLTCAIHDHFSTAGTGMSCDWASYNKRN